MRTILKRILMLPEELEHCPYWEQGKCKAVDYPLNCNYQKGFLNCSKYIEKRVNEIEGRDKE